METVLKPLRYVNIRLVGSLHIFISTQAAAAAYLIPQMILRGTDIVGDSVRLRHLRSAASSAASAADGPVGSKRVWNVCSRAVAQQKHDPVAGGPACAGAKGR